MNNLVRDCYIIFNQNDLLNMTDNEIIEAIRKATNGEFISEGASSTLMGWQQNYDNEGRPLRADPNWFDSYITINSQTYGLIRSGWYAWVIKPEYAHKCHYMAIIYDPNGEKIGKAFVTGQKIDLRPDYVKEYEESMRKDRN